MSDKFLGKWHIELDNDAIIKRCYSFLENHTLYDTDSIYGKLEGKLSSVVMASYLKNNDLTQLMPHNWPELSSLVAEIEKHSNSKCSTSWFNILPKDTDLKEHSHVNSKNHGAIYGSFVYYPEVVPEDSRIELLINNTWTPVSVQSGDYICFELECLHRVPKNKINHNRISIVFNI